MKYAIQTKAIITGLSSRKDGSLRLSMETPELSPDEKVAFMELQGINVDAYFKPLDFEVGEIKEVKNEMETKTPSQRLRAVLFLLWRQEGEQGTYDEFYRVKMEKILDHIKSKLD